MALSVPARLWTLFGPADLGPVAFETLKRRASPNDALAAPPALGSAKSDLEPPVFAADAARLRAAMTKIAASEPRTELVEATATPPTDRWVQRTALLAFPDTIVVRYLDLPGGRSTVAVYSRSQIGRSDFGVNRARIERWLAMLAREVPTAPKS